MTTLERISLEEDDMYLSIHEAPYILTNSAQRKEWEQLGKNF